MSETLLDQILRVIDAETNAWDLNAGEAPVALLWPDRDSEWIEAITELRSHRRVLTLGPLDPSTLTGPAYWLRCVVAGVMEAGDPAELPIVYMPGVGKEALKEPANLANELAPLGPLLFRSLWFTHINGKDWTIRSLLSNTEKGLGLSVGSDNATAEALPAALPTLLRQMMHRITGRMIDVNFVNDLLVPDHDALVLRWLDSPQQQKEAQAAQWSAFRNKCVTDLNFDPDVDGELVAALNLGLQPSPGWEQIWKRYADSPAVYPGVKERLRQAQPGLFPERRENWPGVNAAGEDQLRNALADFAVLAADGARNEVARLEIEHGWRRDTLWADLNESPLACALLHLKQLADATSGIAPAGTVEQLRDTYAANGWKADLALVQALACTATDEDRTAVANASTALYRNWAHNNALALQQAIGPMINAGTYVATPAPSPAEGEVVVFVDGLRLDLAHLLAESLSAFGDKVELNAAFAALPTITETAKPVVAPLDQSALAPGEKLNAARATNGAKADVAVLRSLLVESNVQVLQGSDTGDPSGKAWAECGQVDHKGHDLGTLFPAEVEKEVAQIRDRIRSLLQAGWSTVHIVTDHGWLLLPNGLEKVQIPAAIIENGARKGRCARIKTGANTDLATVPWHWNEKVKIAVAPGIACFTANQVYEHGGVSPQECFVPRMTIQPGSASAGVTSDAVVAIKSITWSGLRCRIELLNAPSNAGVDIRTAAADSSTSVAMATKNTATTGTVNLLVDNDDLEGQTATVVIVGPDGQLLAQRQVTIGSDT